MTCRNLRARARDSLDNSIFSGSWLFLLLACLITSLLSSLLSGCLNIFSLIFVGCIQVGLCAFTLAIVRNSNRKNDLELLFYGFTNNLGTHMLSGLLIGIFTFLWSLLFIIPGIVKAYSYSMTYYVLLDNPELSVLDAIKESERIMRGYKMKAFLLDLSFIGWIFVGSFLCCGIGMLWVTPYMQAAKAHLYEEIRYN